MVKHIIIKWMNEKIKFILLLYVTITVFDVSALDAVSKNRVYSFPNTDLMLCFDSDSTILCGTKGNTEFQVWKYRLIGDTIKVRQWLSCDYINERTIVKCNYDTISVTTFLADVSKEYDAEILYKLFGPAEASFVVNDTNILFGFSENQSVYPFWKINEHSFVCTNAGISDFYNNLSHAIWSPYDWAISPTHSIPSCATREEFKYVDRKLALYYMHEELMYSAKYFCDNLGKNPKIYNSFDKVKLKRQENNLYFEPVIVKSVETDRELFITIIYDFRGKRWDYEVYITDANSLTANAYYSYTISDKHQYVPDATFLRYYEMIRPYISRWQKIGSKDFSAEVDESFEGKDRKYLTFAVHLWLVPNKK